MSLYYVQKLLYQLNRDAELQRRFQSDREAVLAGYELTAEERGAITAPDIGLLYVLGVNGQLLMHYAALCGLEWNAYLEAMREGVRRHGPVRAGVYAMVAD
jgi:Aromatic-ring-opening dioxygenase LigAB, LigA subunit